MMMVRAEPGRRIVWKRTGHLCWVPCMPTLTPKELAHKLIDQLPDAATWQDVLYFLEVRADIEAGLADIHAGRVDKVSDVRKEYGLPE
jgi:hypothetical protein